VALGILMKEVTEAIGECDVGEAGGGVDGVSGDNNGIEDRPSLRSFGEAGEDEKRRRFKSFARFLQRSFWSWLGADEVLVGALRCSYKYLDRLS